MSAPTDQARRGPDDADGREPCRTTRRLLALWAPRRKAAGLQFGTVGDEEEHDRGDSPEVVAAAILIGRACASMPGMVDRLLWEAPVVEITVPDADSAAVLARFLQRCFGQRRLQDLPPDEISLRRMQDPDPGRVPGATIVTACQARSMMESAKRAEEAVRAVRSFRPLVGIACAPRRDLPLELLRLAEARLSIGRLDPASLGCVLEMVTGSPPSEPIAPAFAAAVRLSDLALAVHARRGADGSLARLQAIARPGAPPAEGPMLSELAGFGSALEWGKETATDLRAYARGELAWREVDPGVLLAGPPGTGKTMFAAALAREARVSFRAGSLAQWQAWGDAHLGTTLKAMRAFFDDARNVAPVVALVDELDAFGSRADFPSRDREYWSRIVDGFLECLDGTDGREGVLLVGTTNFPDRVDPAILRAGRLDRRIDVPLPSVEDIGAIFRHHLGGELRDADLSDVARHAAGATGADCASWVRRARASARREHRPIDPGDLLKAIASAGLPCSEDLMRRIAVHEAGHVVVAHALGFPVGSISLNGFGLGLGVRAFAEVDASVGAPTRENIDDTLAALLAGRAAEILDLGEPSAGAAGDLAAATRIAEASHRQWGLGDTLSSSETSVPVRAQERRRIEEDLHRASERADALLRDRRECLEALAEMVLARRYVSRDEVRILLDREGPASVPVPRHPPCKPEAANVTEAIPRPDSPIVERAAPARGIAEA